MKLLLIGGNGFIGRPLIAELHRAGHDLAILHRGARDDASLPADVLHIQGDRNRIPDYESEIRRFAPEIIIDLILSSGEQARQLMSVAHDLTRRILALSSMDTYRAWGVLKGIEPGPLEPLPITEDSPLRTVRQLYPPESMKMLQTIFSWVDDNYDKIAVEEAIMKDPALPGTILRLPMIYGRGDRLHRFFPLLKRIADNRSAVILPKDVADWRCPRGYVDDVAHAIVLAATSPQAAGRIYNICQEPSLPELAWQTKIAQNAGWPGKFIVLPAEQTPKHLLFSGNTLQHVVVSSDRIRRELGYEEVISADQAIRRTIAWEQQNPPAEIDPEQFDYAAEDAALSSTA